MNNKYSVCAVVDVEDHEWHFSRKLGRNGTLPRIDISPISCYENLKGLKFFHHCNEKMRACCRWGFLRSYLQ